MVKTKWLKEFNMNFVEGNFRKSKCTRRLKKYLDCFFLNQVNIIMGSLMHKFSDVS